MFKKAKAIWLDGLNSRMNIQAGFTARFTTPKNHAVIRVTGASLYKLYVNGEFAGYGPARAAHGYVRIDTIDISKHLINGENNVYFEVAGYNCYSFYTLKMLSFLQAEIICDDEVIAYTGRDFIGARIYAREQKVMRYSFQRAFSEVWDLNKDFVQMDVVECKLRLKYLERDIKNPDYRIYQINEIEGMGTFSVDAKIPLVKERHITHVTGEKGIFNGFFEDELISKSAYINQQMVYKKDSSQIRVLNGQKIKENQWILLNAKQNITGFIGTKIKASKDSKILIGFDEKLFDGLIAPKKIPMVNLIEYKLPQSKDAYILESFEVYELKYIMVMVLEGEIELEQMQMRSYMYPVEMDKLDTDDKIVQDIYTAAIETYRQNTLDVFMDCPSRERAGWLCDSYFTAQSEYCFTQKNDVERIFMHNFLLYDGGVNIPKGAIPMCYPADHPDAKFIPQWCMWFVLELEQFLKRSPDINKNEYRDLCYNLVGLLEEYKNSYGLLERLPQWNFIEWSKANEWEYDVNFPTNMLYSRVMEIIGELYNDITLQKRCTEIRKSVEEMAFNGEFFIDNAIRDEKNNLVNTTNISEAGQYYALMFGGININSDKYSVLKNTVINVFGPKREALNLLPHIEFARPFMGIYLRMELLLELEENELLLLEIKDYFGHMSSYSATLWEHNNMENGSLNHGFASFVGVVLKKIVGGEK